MKISLFSQSLYALPLMEAIEATATIGSSAMEIACNRPHFDARIAAEDPKSVAEHIQKAGLAVSALSLFNNFTDKARLSEQIEEAGMYIRLSPLLSTNIVKLTPGPPGFAHATAEHWRCLKIALDQLIPIAEEVGAKLAFETHMRQLTDTLAGSKRLLEIAESHTAGLTVDFSNFMFAGENMPEVFAALKGRMYNTHLKNGTVGDDGSWHFHALDRGLTDYQEVFSLLRNADYDGYLTIECLGADARERPRETARRDLDILKRYLAQK